MNASLPSLPPNATNDGNFVQQPFVLITALYNHKSRFYSDNKFVLLINAPVDGMIEATTFVAKSTNGTDHSQQNFALFRAAPPNIVCKWTTYMAVFDSVENPKSLEIGFGSNSVPVEFQLPYLKKRVQVGTCFSPIFFAENWQLVVLAIEIYRHYGIKLQVVYLMSAIDGIFKILKAYKTKDVIQIEQWPSIKLEDQKYNNINLELDWRNQASAHTDCLMKYGYAAEFLIVGDLDDILVPDHGNYYDEFIRNDYRHKKNAVALLYARYTPDDPKYVVNTSRAESLWIHWPFKIKPNTATRLVPSTEGRMLHFRNWHYSDETGNSTDNYMHMNVKNSVLWRSVALNESTVFGTGSQDRFQYM
uniref:Glycosyltransferase family 92 protein n=1 Tax=Globodera pallida TaxID=36090 RepID=A0A183BTA4_GLOPA